MEKLLIGAAAVAIAFAPISVFTVTQAAAAPCSSSANAPPPSQACIDCTIAHGGAVPCMDIAQQPVSPIAGTPGDQCSRYSAPDETAAHQLCEQAIAKGGHFEN
jgi:hypothetical protein